MIHSAEQLIDFWKRALSVHSCVYFRGAIPEDKLASACEVYGLLHADSVLVLYDDTVFGGGSDGWVLTASPIMGTILKETQDVSGKSPTLTKQLDELKNDDWKVKKGPKGGGSFCDRDGKQIVIEDGMTPKQEAATIAHEVGHAKGAAPTHQGGKTRQEYVDNNTRQHLNDEGNAQFNSCKARDEINQNGGPDIGVPGGPGYDSLYDDHKNGKVTEAQTKELMGEKMGNETQSITKEKYKQHYDDRYGNNWDDHQAKTGGGGP